MTTGKIMKLSNQQKFTLRQKISEFAKNLGFDLVGFSPAKIEKKYLKVFEEWLKNGNAASMEYMRKIEQRRNMDKILPGAKSVIVLGMNYYHEQAPLKRGDGRIARYAYGRDYHKVIGKKLKELEKFIQKSTHSPTQHCTHNVHTKSYVDTGPIMERALAEQAGLGRIGKNGCLITEKFGSWIFLSEIITTLELNFKNISPVTLSTHSPAISPTLSHFQSGNNSTRNSPNRWSSPSQKPFNICGNCTRCITACPTGAIITPGIIDSRLCISYLTIENREKIPPRLAKIIKKTKRLFGCDICQEVCPHNRARSTQKIKDSLTTKPEQNLLNGLLTPIVGDSLNIKKLLMKKSTISPNLSPLSSDAAFLKIFAGSPIMRAKRQGLQRNAKAILKQLMQ